MAQIRNFPQQGMVVIPQNESADGNYSFNADRSSVNGALIINEPDPTFGRTEVTHEPYALPAAELSYVYIVNDFTPSTGATTGNTTGSTYAIKIKYSTEVNVLSYAGFTVLVDSFVVWFQGEQISKDEKYIYLALFNTQLSPSNIIQVRYDDKIGTILTKSTGVPVAEIPFTVPTFMFKEIT